MAKAKTSDLKRILAKAIKQNRRLPLFVIARTKRRLTRNAQQRNWRDKKLGLYQNRTQRKKNPRK